LGYSLRIPSLLSPIVLYINIVHNFYNILIYIKRK